MQEIGKIFKVVKHGPPPTEQRLSSNPSKCRNGCLTFVNTLSEQRFKYILLDYKSIFGGRSDSAELCLQNFVAVSVGEIT